MKKNAKTYVRKFNQQHGAEKNLSIVALSLLSFEDGKLVLGGEVLREKTLSDFRQEAFAELEGVQEVDTSAVRVLLTGETEVYRVAKNITSMHADASFLSEMTTQIFYGDEVAVIRDEGDWVYGCNLRDGYLSYAYKKYLETFTLPPATHIVSAPSALVYAASSGDDILTRVLAGTYTSILDESGGRALIYAPEIGWVEKDALRAVDDFPKPGNALRRDLCESAWKLIGVPYLWGGSSAFGIDCSGLVQLVYRCAGIELRRDAHMQFEQGRKIKHPFVAGDALFFGDEKGAIDHVGMSLGGWKIIHSSRAKNGVYIDDVLSVPHLRDSFIGAARLA